MIGKVFAAAWLVLACLSPALAQEAGAGPTAAIDDGPYAVSYTHLDVYKRQPWTCWEM